jgi:hypothetical protein
LLRANAAGQKRGITEDKPALDLLDMSQLGEGVKSAAGGRPAQSAATTDFSECHRTLRRDDELKHMQAAR